MTEEKKKASSQKQSDERGGAKSGINLDKDKVDIKKLLEAGVHFGHSKSRKNPRMEKYIFGTKRGINIIDLQKTVEGLEQAIEFIKQLTKEDKKILLVGTKKQSKNLIKETGVACRMPFVEERWLGGTFTNFPVIKKRAQYLKESQDKMNSGKFEKYTKLEQLKKMEELEKLEKKMGGIKEMAELPGAIFIVDIKNDEIALREAIKAGVPVIAMVDTNVNPENVDYPIPANDDALSSIKLILEYIGTAIIKK